MKEYQKLAKKLPKEDVEHASKMWNDGDVAGRIAMRAIDRDNGLLGTIAGVGTGKAISKFAIKGRHSKN